MNDRPRKILMHRFSFMGFPSLFITPLDYSVSMNLSDLGSIPVPIGNIIINHKSPENASLE
jgi:hypothetical protein